MGQVSARLITRTHVNRQAFVNDKCQRHLSNQKRLPFNMNHVILGPGPLKYVYKDSTIINCSVQMKLIADDESGFRDVCSVHISIPFINFL